MTKIVSSTGKVTRDDLKNDRVRESRAKEVRQLKLGVEDRTSQAEVRTSGYIQEATCTKEDVVAGIAELKAQDTNAMLAGECWKIHAQDYKRLLGHVLDALDASLPNKQQHAAATRMVRNIFDKTYYQMMQLTSPDVGFGQIEGCYAVEPVR